MVLHGDEVSPAVHLGGHVRLLKLPGEHGAGADVAGLAGLNDVVHGLHGLFNRGVPVPAVQDVHVDVVKLQALEAVVYLAHYSLAGGAGAVRAGAHFLVDLGLDDQLVAVGLPALEGVAEYLLAGADGIHVRGVKPVEAEVERVLDHLVGLVLADEPGTSPAVEVAEAHASDADAGDVEPAPAELLVFHAVAYRRGLEGCSCKCHFCSLLCLL